MSSMYPTFGGTSTRPCTSCGSPLNNNQARCSQCGIYNPLPQGQLQIGQNRQPGNGEKRSRTGVRVVLIVLILALVGGGGYGGYYLYTHNSSSSTTTNNKNTTKIVLP